jgi:phosphinothricin acetyltransferase
VSPDADPRLRRARPADGPALSAIYRPAVESSAVTFEESAPDAATMAARVRERDDRYPWLVADGRGTDEDGRVVGYAAAGAFDDRGAYRWSVTTSVYVDAAHRGSGVGSRLYRALLDVLATQGFVNAYALVTEPNPPSTALHRSFGFEPVGRLDGVGYKQGAWRDVRYWHRRLRDPPAEPDPPRPLSAVDEDRVVSVLDGNAGRN